MESLLQWSVILGGLALLTDILSKLIDGMYACHSDLLIRPSSFRRTRLRAILLFFMMAVMGGLLLTKSFMPTVFAANWLFCVLLFIIIITDYEQQLIFDRILLGLALSTLIFSFAIDATLWDRAAAAAIGGTVMLLLALIPGGVIGGGDVKLLFVLGLWQGTDQLMDIFVTGFLGGGCAAGFLLLFCKGKRKDLFAYGPYFAVGALLNLFL